jgi:hypothetical protein
VVFDLGVGRVRLDRLNALFGTGLRLVSLAGSDDLAVRSLEVVVGLIQGLPVVTDPNIETNLGAGGDEDPVYVLRASDVVLWESGIRARVLPETKAHPVFGW